MTFYECVFLARQDVSAQDVHKLSDKFAQIFTDAGGKLIKKEYWGLRATEHKISKNWKGHYVMLVVEANSDSIKEFERNCKINEDVIRFSIFRICKVSDQPSPMMQAPAKASTAGFHDDAVY